jgi:UDP-N-acetylglucosamine diphosphorylase/glucosamine-1-phosphate N-acetyltransferase
MVSMNLKICLYEDKTYRNFFPLTHTRPVYFLRPGIEPIYHKVRRHFKDTELCLGVRDQLTPLLVEKERDIPINIVKRSADQDILFLNGRIRDYGNLAELIPQCRISTRFASDGQTVAVLLKSAEIESLPTIATPTDYGRHIAGMSDELPEADTTATVYNYCWDIMADIGARIRDDFAFLMKSAEAPQAVRVADGARLVGEREIYLGHGVRVNTGAIIDATDGPIYIGDNSQIDSMALLKGPCYIGPNTIVARGVIAGSSIGHTCRVGGEVEESIFHEYVNKHHEGFIGHGLVGAWVNFGALTTNSDLKNNYSVIRVSLDGEQVDTGSIKVGSFIGDHTKFGIGTLLTTGINIGTCCNIFGGTLITDKEVDSFRWGSTGSFVEHDFDKAMDTNKKVMARRNATLSANEVSALQSVFQKAISDDGTIGV